MTMTKLGEALRRKFKTPQAALARLGLDAALLRESARDMVHGTSDHDDEYWHRSGDHESGWDRRRARDGFTTPEDPSSNIEPKVETMPEQRLSNDDRDDDQDDAWAPFAFSARSNGRGRKYRAIGPGAPHYTSSRIESAADTLARPRWRRDSPSSAPLSRLHRSPR
jgi:hypothetical protein